MNVREVLDRDLVTNEDGDYVVRPEYLASIIEGALRVAWAEGYTDGKGLTPHIKPGSDNGVTAFVAAMTEESSE